MHLAQTQPVHLGVRYSIEPHHAADGSTDLQLGPFDVKHGDDVVGYGATSRQRQSTIITTIAATIAYLNLRCDYIIKAQRINYKIKE